MSDEATNGPSLQGKIPRHARKLASDIGVETGLSKLLIYDGLIELALAFQEVKVPDLNVKDQEHDTHRSPSLRLDTKKVRSFRRAKGIKRNADVFRHSMHHGATLMRWYLEDGLPPPMRMYRPVIAACQVAVVARHPAAPSRDATR